MDNTDIQEIDIIALASNLNDTAMSKSQVLDKYGIKDGKARKLLKDNGYMYNTKSRKWELASKSDDTVNSTKVTYRIDTELYQAIKLQAIFEGVSATDIVIKALDKYIPKSTKDIVKANRK